MADEAYAALEPLTGTEAENGYPLRAVCRAIGSMFAQSEEATRALEGFDPWTQAWDVTRCPAWLLPFLGQAVGVSVTPGLTTAEQRALIEAEGAWKRGWLTTLVSRVQSTLTGAKGVRVVERNTTAWTLLLITRPSETPKPTDTKRVAEEWTPLGIKLVLEESDLPLIDEGTKEIDAATVATIDTATLAQVT